MNPPSKLVDITTISSIYQKPKNSPGYFHQLKPYIRGHLMRFPRSPKIQGSVGFLFVLFVATVTAIVEQQTLMRASVECNATTFQELCQRTPAWARQTTIWSGLIYLWACALAENHRTDRFFLDQTTCFFCLVGLWPIWPMCDCPRISVLNSRVAI